MKWSIEQTKSHQEGAEKFREAYVRGENKITSIEDVINCQKRCLTLINPNIPLSVGITIIDIRDQSSEFYFQEIPHFTVDCHRYLTENNLPFGINQMEIKDQKEVVVSSIELNIYDRVLKEEFGKEEPYQCEIKGVAFGGDGLIAQVWYDDKKMIDFTSRLGEKVEVRSLVWIFNGGWSSIKFH